MTQIQTSLAPIAADVAEIKADFGKVADYITNAGTETTADLAAVQAFAASVADVKTQAAALVASLPAPAPAPEPAPDQPTS